MIASADRLPASDRKCGWMGVQGDIAERHNLGNEGEEETREKRERTHPGIATRHGEKAE